MLAVEAEEPDSVWDRQPRLSRELAAGRLGVLTTPANQLCDSDKPDSFLPECTRPFTKLPIFVVKEVMVVMVVVVKPTAAKPTVPRAPTYPWPHAVHSGEPCPSQGM